MALTAEQQSQFELAEAMENTRHNNNVVMENNRTKLEAIRMSKDVLIENARSKPVDSREVTAANITAFADTLVASINA